MYIPNIPGISTSIIDRTSIEKTINNNRVVLLAGFFRYGKEGFNRIDGGVPEFEEVLGKMDLKKYGNAHLYGTMSAKSSKVIAVRLLPADATFANNVLSYTGVYSTKKGITTKDQVFLPTNDNGDLVENDTLFSVLATERGDGYNSIFVTFKEAIEYEKEYSNKYGELNYRFNFVQAEVYEETPNGVVSKSDSIVFSLLEHDPMTGEPIVDKVTGKSIYINHIFKESNAFATAMINDEKYGSDMESSTNIKTLLDEKRLQSGTVGIDGRFIVKDINLERYYELYVETYSVVVQNDAGVNSRVDRQRIAAKIVNYRNNAGFSPVLKYVVDDATKYAKISVDNFKVSYAAETVANGDNISDVYYLDGSSSYFKFTIEELDNDIIGTFNEYTGDMIDDNGIDVLVPFTRHSLYKNLIKYSMKLYSGYDGANLHTSVGSLNMITPGTVTAKNAQELVVDFYNNNQEIREVLYPRYDFDYIGEWTDKGRVQSAIINLADSIGTTMPILGLPLAYNPKVVTSDLVDRDLLTRKEGLFWSSYNTALYSGQLNKTHVLASGRKIYLGTSYYALAAHLRIDNTSITEPVANIQKGTIDTEFLNLTYAPTSLEIEQLRNEQVNTIISEPDGNYIIDQLTMYKKASKLSRINVVKVLHRIRKDLPKLLKDLIQLKSTSDITGDAIERADTYLKKWQVTEENEIDGIFESINVDGVYNSETYKLRLTITVNPIGTIESIDIPIIVI